MSSEGYITARIQNLFSPVRYFRKDVLLGVDLVGLCDALADQVGRHEATQFLVRKAYLVIQKVIGSKGTAKTD